MDEEGRYQINLGEVQEVGLSQVDHNMMNQERFQCTNLYSVIAKLW